eukprot:5849841-Amphidinium_carterae.1
MSKTQEDLAHSHPAGCFRDGAFKLRRSGLSGWQCTSYSTTCRTTKPQCAQGCNQAPDNPLTLTRVWTVL